MKKILICGVVALLCSCSQRTEVKVDQPQPLAVGVVDHVYAKQKYVLVRLNGYMPKESSVLISQSPKGVSPERVANLLVSGERIGNLRVPADIRSGEVEKGDIVYLYRNLAAPAPSKQPDNIAPVDKEIDKQASSESPETKPTTTPTEGTGEDTVQPIPLPDDQMMDPNAVPEIHHVPDLRMFH